MPGKPLYAAYICKVLNALVSIYQKNCYYTANIAAYKQIKF